MKTVKDMIDELNTVLEAGLTNDLHQWINDKHDTVCVLSSSRIEDILGRVTAHL